MNMFRELPPVSSGGFVFEGNNFRFLNIRIFLFFGVKALWHENIFKYFHSFLLII